MRIPSLGFAIVVLVSSLAHASDVIQPVVNGDFDTYAVASVSDEGRFALDRCFGVGHQAYDPLYSAWADWAFATGAAAQGDPQSLAAGAQDPATPGQATGYPAAHAQAVAGSPSYAYRCDAKYRDAAQFNAWEKSHDVGFAWSNDPGTKFYDHDSDGDVEAVIPRAIVSHTHALWQSVATPGQAMSANFRTFEWTLESGVIPAAAYNEIGLSFSPGWDQNPWVGPFWDGGIRFRSNDMTPDEDGRVRLDPALQGEIVCPDYAPCRSFKAAFDGASVEDRRELLGQARIVQMSFWRFAGGLGAVAIDDVGFTGVQTAAEGVVAATE